MTIKQLISRTIASIGDRLLDKLEERQLYYSHRWRTSTFPYISGDSFLSIAGYAALRSSRRIIERQALCHPSLRHVLFSEVPLEPETLRAFINSRKIKMIIHHNCDHPPSPQIRDLLHRKNVLLKSVNLLDPLSSEECIPLGIENLSYRRNSPLSEFSATPPFIQKENLFHISVRSNTNDAVRKVFLDQITSINLTNRQLRRLDYYDLIRKSYYTLCPLGNGIDTHRFWEAIYKESIPVVLTESYLFADLTLPVLVLKNNWTDLSFFDSANLIVHYHHLQKLDCSMAYMPFWTSRVLQQLE